MEPAKEIITDVSEAETKLRELDKRDIRFKVFLLLVAVILTAFNIFTVVRLQYITSQSQAQAVQARKTNFDRQSEIKAYIKCVVLLRYDNPGLSPESPKADVEKALDRCVELTKPKENVNSGTM